MLDRRRATTAAILIFLLPVSFAAAADPPPREIEAMIDAMPAPAAIAPDAAPAQGPTIDAGRGPIPVHVPPSYDPEVPMPLVILLHGYSSSGAGVESYVRLAARADEYGFLYLYPDGTPDCFGLRHWNATDACCQFCGPVPDDSAYLLNVVNTMKDQYNVDPRRVHFAGHSNGGFMSYRMACDHSETVAAIASLAGATFLDPADCAPAGPVHTLQIHGTNDTVIGYDGGCIRGICYPGAVATTEQWAAFDGCKVVGEQLPDPLDLDAGIPGAETTVTQYVNGCDPGGSARLWTIAGGAHSPNLTTDFSRLVVEYLLGHPKPSDCPADLDGDDDVGFGDILIVLSAWGPVEPCPPFAPQDLDADCDVGFGDLLLVLSSWGECE